MREPKISTTITEAPQTNTAKRSNQLEPGIAPELSSGDDLAAFAALLLDDTGRNPLRKDVGTHEATSFNSPAPLNASHLLLRRPLRCDAADEQRS
jgi:hypothetical protein